MVNVGMDVHADKTIFHLFDPAAPLGQQHRRASVPTTAESLRAVLAPLNGACRVAFEVGTQA